MLLAFTGKLFPFDYRRRLIRTRRSLQVRWL
jgi:hypothetical protein